MDEFIEGAEMAYNDCADLMETFARDIPDELSFMKDSFIDISNGFREKIILMKSMKESMESGKQ